MSNRLAEVRQAVSEHMDSILSNFKAGAKITVLVRTPSNNEADFVLTNDERLWSLDTA